MVSRQPPSVLSSLHRTQKRFASGSIIGNTDATGADTATSLTDEFGVGAAPASRLGYLGADQRFTTDTTLGLIRMGARLYDPALGRFLEVDPIRGGSANAYDYVNQDPIDGLDLSGDISFCSEDFCDAVNARIEKDTPESALETSAAFVYNSQDARDRYRLDKVPIVPTSMKHDWLNAVALTGETFAMAFGRDSRRRRGAG